MNKSSLLLVLASFLLTVGGGFAANAAPAPYQMDRTVLPIQPPARIVVTEMDARDATRPERFEIKPPEGAPNVVIVLIDDIGSRPQHKVKGVTENDLCTRRNDLFGRHGLDRAVGPYRHKGGGINSTSLEYQLSAAGLRIRM